MTVMQGESYHRFMKLFALPILLTSLVVLLAAPTRAHAQSMSILGKDVEVERVKAAYLKVRKKYVFEENMRQLVTESEYVKAWESTQKKKAEDERRRQQDKRNPYNRNSGNTVSSVKIDGSSGGLRIHDQNKPEFEEFTGVVVKPGRDAVVRTEKGDYILVRFKQVHPANGAPLYIKAKLDPDRKEHRVRNAKGELVMPIYHDVTMSSGDFMNLLRKGAPFSELPELRQKESASQFGQASSPLRTAGSSFGSGESRLGSGKATLGKNERTGGLSGSGGGLQRSSSGFAEPRTSTIRR